jgi:hypothetical protein
MRAVVDFSQSLNRHVGVDVRRFELFVAKLSLNAS